MTVQLPQRRSACHEPPLKVQRLLVQCQFTLQWASGFLHYSRGRRSAELIPIGRHTLQLFDCCGRADSLKISQCPRALPIASLTTNGIAFSKPCPDAASAGRWSFDELDGLNLRPLPPEGFIFPESDSEEVFCSISKLFAAKSAVSIQDSVLLAQLDNRLVVVEQMLHNFDFGGTPPAQ